MDYYDRARDCFKIQGKIRDWYHSMEFLRNEVGFTVRQSTEYLLLLEKDSTRNRSRR